MDRPLHYIVWWEFSKYRLTTLLANKNITPSLNFTKETKQSKCIHFFTFQYKNKKHWNTKFTGDQQPQLRPSMPHPNSQEMAAHNSKFTDYKTFHYPTVTFTQKLNHIQYIAI